MADFIARIKPRKSSVSGESPSAADLDVAEIAVNTADGKLFVKHTDNSIKEISGSGGGGGTVQDTARTSPLSVTTSSLANGAAEFKTLTGTARSGQFIRIETSHAARVIYYSTTAARTADIARAQGTSPLTSSGVLLEVITTGVQTIEVTPAILYQNSEVGAAGELYLSITNLSGSAAAVEVETVVVPIEGRGIYMSEVDDLLDVDVTGVADGDGIVYDAATSKWIPGSTAAPVDSVNGETGVVSLGVQDMDDFRLKQLLNPAHWTGSWEVDELSVGNLHTAGGMGVGSDTHTVHFSPIDRAGVDLEAALLAAQGNTIYFSKNGSAFAAATVYTSTAISSGVDRTIKLTSLALHTALQDRALGDIYVLTSEPYVSQPLAEGDFLQWNDLDSKFEPAQLKNKIQETDDFQLEDDPAKQSNPSFTVNWNWVGVGNSGFYFSDPGDFATSVSGWQINPSTADGTDLTTILNAWYASLTSGDTIKLRWEELDGTIVLYDHTFTNGNNQTGDSGTYRPRLYFQGGLPGGAPMSTDVVDFRILSLEQYAVDNGLETPVHEEAELFEGDILRWNDTDKKFKPTFLPTPFSGSYNDLTDVPASTAPVDSVNGETGVVSLSVQDMDDFLLNQELDPLAFNSEFTISALTGGQCQTAGNIAPQYDAAPAKGDGAIVSRFDSDGVNIESALIAYSGSSLYLTINGGASQSITIGTVSVYTGCAPASTHRSLFVGNAALKTAIDNAQVGDTVKLSSEPYIDVDLADGDILQWVDSDSKFKPAQLPAVPVDSINGETGVVSLSVQDMDDFEKIAQVSSSHRYTLMPDTDAAWPTVAAGQYAVASDGSWLRFNYEDADGDTVAFTASADIWTTTNLAGSWATGNANTTSDDGANIRYFFRGAGAAINADLGATTHLSVINPTAVTYAPLADGDILQWVDIDSKFKPAQLAEVIDKATLKSEVAASTDFADFQSRIAAL